MPMDKMERLFQTVRRQQDMRRLTRAQFDTIVRAVRAHDAGAMDEMSWKQAMNCNKPVFQNRFKRPVNVNGRRARSPFAEEV